MRKLIFFLGGAGAGKTTLAKAVAIRRRAALFDMDTLLRPAAEVIMAVSGLDPSDRDSPVYKSLCRDLGYRLTMDAALENVELGSDAIVVGPFTKETSDPAWIGKELAGIGASLEDVDVRAVFVYLSGERLHRERIKGRASELDDWKLGNWSEFSKSLAPRDIKWNLPAGSILYFDNSGEITEEKVSVLEKFLFE